MTLTQLRSLIGCILKFKSFEYIIYEVNDKTLKYQVQNSELREIEINDFIENYIPKLKIYITEEEKSLVSINTYIIHYDLK